MKTRCEKQKRLNNRLRAKVAVHSADPISWDLNSNWKPDTTVSSEVEVRFIAQGPQATLVELEHRNFERLGAEAGASMRKDVDGGWPGMLEHFKREAETSSRPTQARRAGQS